MKIIIEGKDRIPQSDLMGAVNEYIELERVDYPNITIIVTIGSKKYKVNHTKTKLALVFKVWRYKNEK